MIPDALPCFCFSKFWNYLQVFLLIWALSRPSWQLVYLAVDRQAGRQAGKPNAPSPVVICRGYLVLTYDSTLIVDSVLLLPDIKLQRLPFYAVRQVAFSL